MGKGGEKHESTHFLVRWDRGTPADEEDAGSGVEGVEDAPRASDNSLFKMDAPTFFDMIS